MFGDWRVMFRDHGKLVASSILTATFCLTGCSNSPDAFEMISEVQEGADRVRVYSSWSELQRLSHSRADEFDVLQVVGEVLAVDDGAAFSWSTEPDGGEQRTQLPFDSDDAMVRTLHLTVRVDRVVGYSSEVQREDEIMIGVAFSAESDLSGARDSFNDLPQSLFFLTKTAVFDYEPNLWGVLEDGALLAVPNDDGYLSFPALERNDAVQPPKGTSLEDVE